MRDQKIIPLSTYPGRKGSAGTWQKIISEIPKCDRFIDAMCGSGYISSLVTGCQIIINDIDRSVIDKINCAAAIVKENESYPYLIKKYGLPGSVFYFDPPYMLGTRSYKGPIYKHEWGGIDHTIFLERVKEIKQPVMVSHYPCDMYDIALKDWRKITYTTMTRAGARIENLYMNYLQPALLQCYKSVGENYTDRQRIKRKVERLANRLENEDPKDRAAILSSIIDKFNFVVP